MFSLFTLYKFVKYSHTISVQFIQINFLFQFIKNFVQFSLQTSQFLSVRHIQTAIQ